MEMRRAAWSLMVLTGLASGCGNSGDRTDRDDDVTPDELVESVVAADQTVDPANRVVIASVVSKGMGWLVVHSETGGGAPGAAFGHAGLTHGTHNDVEVLLDRVVDDGERLLAVLHTDAGAIGTYEFPGADAIAQDDAGATIMDDFIASLPPAPTFENTLVVQDQTQSAFSTQVAIASASAAAPSWIAVYDDASGGPGSLLGRVPLGPSSVTNLVVTLARPVAAAETLWARLHVDAGTAGLFEPSTADVVATGLAGPLAASFVATPASGVPAVRIHVTGSSGTGYSVVAVSPSAFGAAVLGGATGEDVTLTLTKGWRYEVQNATTSGHPFELITAGTSDVVLLSQSAAGSLESDAATAWSEGTSSARFTVSTALAAAANGYRCAIHTATMRGTILIVD